MNNVFFCTVIVCTACLLTGCKNETITSSQYETNLLKNGSFEVFGRFSLEGWSVLSADSTSVTSSTDVPFPGNGYSVKLKNEWTFPGTITQTVAVPPGTHLYSLSAYSKVIQGRQFAGGEMGMGLQHADSIGAIKWLGVSDSAWKWGTILDTLTINRNDSIFVIFRGNPHQLSFGYTLFARCELDMLD